jgi:hypothetical protein
MVTQVDAGTVTNDKQQSLAISTLPKYIITMAYGPVSC